MIKIKKYDVSIILKTIGFIFFLLPGLPYNSFPQEIIISEIMFNPEGDENAREFVEILNLSEEELSLEGYIIGDGTGFDNVVTAEGNSWIVPGGSFALILDPDYFSADEPYDEIPGNIPVFTVNDKAIGERGLSNSYEEKICLISGKGDTLSTVTYSLECSPGHSWERIIPYGGDTLMNFQESRETEGTPGRKNSVTPPLQNPALKENSLRFNPLQPKMNDEVELIVTYLNAGLEPVSEIKVTVWMLPDIIVGTALFPEKVAPGEISGEKYIHIDSIPGGLLAFIAAVEQNGDATSAEDHTLAVALDTTVPKGTLLLNEIMAAPKDGETEWIEVHNQSLNPVDLFHWSIGDISGRSGLVNEHVFIPENGYAVISDGLMFQNMTDASPVIVVDSFPVLNNDRDTVMFYDFAGALTDSVTYGNTSYGYSFELISNLMSGTFDGWDKCVDTYGSTPGELNSVNFNRFEETGRKIDSIQLSATPNPFLDFVTLSYRLPFPLARIRLFIYDRRGRLVAEIRDTEESGSEWKGTWDGTSEGSRLPAGPYILNLEALNKSTGKAYTERKTIVIATNL